MKKLDNKISKVLDFNKSFGLLKNKRPSLIDEDEYNLRYSLMTEELKEYREACIDDDIVEISDAIVDLLYVLNGMIVAHGLQDVIEDMYDEVHKSNMSKLENGKPLYRHDGKVLKGSEYFEPNLIQFLPNEYWYNHSYHQTDLVIKMSAENRHNFLTNTFDDLHRKLNNAYEEVYDGEFEKGNNTLNSIIYDIREIKKIMRPWEKSAYV